MGLKIRRQLGLSLGSELILLLAASIALVIILALAATHSTPLASGGFGMTSLGIAMVLAAAGLGLALVWRLFSRSASWPWANRSDMAELKRNLHTAEAVLKAEPQVLVFWQPGQAVDVVTHSLTTVRGLPENPLALMKFGQWLEPQSADELKTGLDALFEDGRAFNLLLRTTSGGNLEADGRAVGGRAILRLRDVAGYKQDLARILDQHRQLTRDVRTGRALLNALPTPAWLRNADGRIEWVNTAYVKAVDAADDSEVREKQIELLESRQRSIVTAGLAGNQPLVTKVPLIIGGEPRTHEITVLPAEGGSAGVAADITALEKAAGELDRQMVAFDRTLNRVATAIAIFDKDQRLTFFNEAYRKLWQLNADWLTSGPTDSEILDRLRSLSRLPHIVSQNQTPEKIPAAVNYRDWRAKVMAHTRTGRVYEEGWHLPDGRMLEVAIEPRPDGGVTHLYDDVTEKLALESRYHAQIDVQRETIDHLKEGVAVFSTDGRLQIFNSAFANIWKLSRRMLAEGPHVDDVLHLCRVLHDDDVAWTEIGRCVTVFTDSRSEIAGQMTRGDGSVIDYSCLPLPDGGTLVTFADVTDSKRYERALVERNEALIAADRLKSQFINHVSYETRTPLTSIIGFSELLESPRTGPLQPKQREYLSAIMAESNKLLGVIDDMLDLASMDAGALELSPAPVKVRTIVDAAVLGVRDRLGRTNLRFEVNVATDVIDIVADEGRMRQVLYNLISNAIGFSHPGGYIRLSCWRDGTMIAFSVEDNGLGIPKEQQRAVMERFVSRSRGSRHRGVGLGLSIVQSLVELHGGQMKLESEAGVGTRVTVLLPEMGPRQMMAHPQRDSLNA